MSIKHKGLKFASTARSRVTSQENVRRSVRNPGVSNAGNSDIWLLSAKIKLFALNAEELDIVLLSAQLKILLKQTT